ncbi:MAG: DciA family protein [Burkholderiales bacterium]
MPTRKLSALLSNTAGLSALTRASQRITALQRLYAVCAPPELTQASRVIHEHGGMLVIAADNGAIAAKLRQMTPRLLKNLQKQTAEVTGIRVQIQVNKVHSRPAGGTKMTTLPIDLIESFDRLSKQIKDSRLRSALVRFAARRRGG